MNLTDHFTQEELGVAGCDDAMVKNAAWLCVTILEPIRQHFGSPIRVHCGYRDPNHNRRVGGKPESWHLFDFGRAAADFDVLGVPLQDVFDWIRLHSALPFDKAILERHSNGVPACIHIQFDWMHTGRRQAFIGSTGAAFDYQQVEVA